MPDNEAIWAEIASEEQSGLSVQHLSNAWSAEILKAEAEGYLLPDEISDEIGHDDKYVYSKVSI